MSAREDIDFMNELDAATRMRPTILSHVMLISVTSLVVAFVLWAGVSQIEEITRGIGQVVPTR